VGEFVVGGGLQPGGLPATQQLRSTSFRCRPLLPLSSVLSNTLSAVA
jgi:hypothetical protein